MSLNFNKHINMTYLFEICDQDIERVKAILSVFLESVRKDWVIWIQKLSNDGEDLRGISHKLKSQMNYLQADAFAKSFEIIEKSGDEQARSEAKAFISAHFEALLAEVEIVYKDLKN